MRDRSAWSLALVGVAMMVGSVTLAPTVGLADAVQSGTVESPAVEVVQSGGVEVAPVEIPADESVADAVAPVEASDGAEGTPVAVAPSGGVSVPDAAPSGGLPWDLPACESEDAVPTSGGCVWDAAVRGNGAGRSFVTYWDGSSWYLDTTPTAPEQLTSAAPFGQPFTVRGGAVVAVSGEAPAWVALEGGRPVAPAGWSVVGWGVGAMDYRTAAEVLESEGGRFAWVALAESDAPDAPVVGWAVVQAD